MSKDTRIPCYIIGQGTTFNGKLTYDNYVACPLPPLCGTVADTFAIHAKDGERRRGSGEYFHAARYGIPSQMSVLTNQGIKRFSGFYPRSFAEAGLKKQGTAWTACNGHQAFLCWLSYDPTRSGDQRCVSAWVYDGYDARFDSGGNLVYTMSLELWTSKFFYRDYLSMPDIYDLTVQMMVSHTSRQYWTKEETQPSRNVRYILDKITVHPSSKSFSMMDYTHNEWDAYQWFKLGRSLGDYGLMPNWYRFGLSTAFCDAVSSIPDSSVNGLEAVLDLCDLATTLRHPIKGLKSAMRSIKRVKPGDIWLKYRYVFKTTEMDIDSIRDLSQRIDVLRTLCAPVKLHGVHREEGALFRCKASFSLPAAQLQALDSIPSYMGGSLSAADVWDVVPWSFMVDWILHVSDLLESLEGWGRAQEAQYRLSDVWYSVETSTRDQTVYFRIPGDPKRPMMGSPYLITRQASKKTIMMRVTDCFAIFGRKE